MRLSTSTNGVFYQQRDRRGNFVPIEQCLAECARAGFRVMDINCCDNADPGMPLALDDWESWTEHVLTLASSLGLAFSQSHNPIYNFCHPETVENFAWWEEMTRRSVLCAGRLGVRWIVVHAGTAYVDGRYDERETVRRNVEYFAPMAELAVSAGCAGLAIENMARSAAHDQLCETADGLIELVEAFHSPHVGVCWDFGHAHLTDEQQPESLRKIGPRLRATHVADNSGVKDDHTLPMLGTVPWETVMPVLRAIGYRGDFTYEIHKYMWNAPARMRPAMLQLAVQAGEYLIGLADSAGE